MIHKEGYRTLALGLVAAGVITACICFLTPQHEALHRLVYGIDAFIWLMLIQFFRNPRRAITVLDNTVLSPADGKIVVIEEVFEADYLKEKAIQISVFMSPLDVHVNRNPVSGQVRLVRHHPGKYLVAWHPKSSAENERTTIIYEMADKRRVLLRQIAGAMARRIVFYLKEGGEVIQGEQMGFIKFGSRVDLFLPLSATIKITLDQKVTGGKTVIATL